MTLAYKAGGIITGVSSDTKPTTAPDGTTFVETDTKKWYIIASGTWSEFAGAAVTYQSG